MTTDDAVAYVIAKMAAIRALPNNIVKQRQALAYIRDAANASGQLTNAQAAQTRLDEALSDLGDAVTMNNRLDEVLNTYDEVKQAFGLGVFPVIPVVAGIMLVTIGGMAVLLFKAYDTRASAIQALAAGTLTPEQYTELMNQQSNTGLSGLLGDAKNLLLLGIGAVVVMAVLKYAPTRRTA